MAEVKKDRGISEREQDLIKGVFKDNDYLLKLIRSLFFGFSITVKEKELIKSTFKNTDLKEALRKKIYPIMSADSPIGQITDFWMGTESQIFGAQKDAIYQSVHSKQMVKEMLEHAISLLDDPAGQKIDLGFTLEDKDPLQVKLLARNLYMKTIEQGLLFIKLTADDKTDSVAEVKKRALQNSSK